MSKRSRKKNRFMTNSRREEKKVSQKQWSNFQYLNAGLLKYADYQRGRREAKIESIIKNYNPNLVNPLKVSLRDGQYWVYDGQHTLEAHRKMKGNNDFLIACIVHHGLTYEEEARLFALQDGESTKVGASDQVKALEEAKDEDTIAFLTATRESGFDIIPGRRLSRNGCIAAVAKAKECYKKLGDHEYRHILKLLKDTWDGEKWSVENTILAGMCLLLKTYGAEVDDNRFMKKMAGVDATDINRIAGRYYDLSMPFRYAMAMATIYNKGGAKGTLKLRKLSFQMEGE